MDIDALDDDMDDYWKASGNVEIAARVTKEQEERKAKVAAEKAAAAEKLAAEQAAAAETLASEKVAATKAKAEKAAKDLDDEMDSYWTKAKDAAEEAPVTDAPAAAAAEAPAAEAASS